MRRHRRLICRPRIEGNRISRNGVEDDLCPRRETSTECVEGPSKNSSCSYSCRLDLRRSCRQFKGAQMKLARGKVAGCFGRHLDKREHRAWILPPDCKIGRGHGEPTEREHVAAGLGHTAGLLPGDLVDHPLRSLNSDRAAGCRRRHGRTIKDQSTCSARGTRVSDTSVTGLLTGLPTGSCSTVTRWPSTSWVTST